MKMIMTIMVIIVTIMLMTVITIKIKTMMMMSKKAILVCCGELVINVHYVTYLHSFLS